MLTNITTELATKNRDFAHAGTISRYLLHKGKRDNQYLFVMKLLSKEVAAYTMITLSRSLREIGEKDLYRSPTVNIYLDDAMFTFAPGVLMGCEADRDGIMRPIADPWAWANKWSSRLKSHEVMDKIEEDVRFFFVICKQQVLTKASVMAEPGVNSESFRYSDEYDGEEDETEEV